MPEFGFLKAVDKSLVISSIVLWEFLTLKHVIGQGPIYIRSVSNKNDNIDNCNPNDDNQDLNDHVLTTRKEHESSPSNELCSSKYI